MIMTYYKDLDIGEIVTTERGKMHIIVIVTMVSASGSNSNRMAIKRVKLVRCL